MGNFKRVRKNKSLLEIYKYLKRSFNAKVKNCKILNLFLTFFTNLKYI